MRRTNTPIKDWFNDPVKKERRQKIVKGALVAVGIGLVIGVALLLVL